MAKGLLGKKIGMTQIFASNGKVVPVTVVEASPNLITQIKSVESDGYNALQIGVGVVKDKKLTKAQKGHFEKANVKPVRFIREVRLPSAPEQKLGDTISVDIFAKKSTSRLIPSNSIAAKTGTNGISISSNNFFVPTFSKIG